MKAKKPKVFETGYISPLSFKVKSVPLEKVNAHWQKILKVITEENNGVHK